MSHLFASPAAIAAEHEPGAPTRLRGRRLIAARITWLAFLVASVVQVLFATPIIFQQYATPCAADCSGSLLTAASMRQLESLGISATAWAIYAVGLELFFAGAWGTVACLIFWRKGDEPLAWFVSLTLLTFGHAFPGFTDVLRYADKHPFWTFLAAPVIFVGVCGIIIFFYIFPDGRFVPRWTRWLSAGWVIWTAYSLATTALDGTMLYYATYYAALALGVACQIYRYRHVADVVQRQQTKWVVFGVAMAIAIFLGLNAAAILGMPLWSGQLGLTFFTQTAIYLGMALIPFSIDMAIFRARLWDVDIIISRALVYGALTLSVVGIYVLVVGYLATLFQTSGNLAISLLATGLVAVLFQPLRARLQRGVNHLLYGERDDPYAVISRLGQRLEATLAPEAVLPAIVETVAEALKLPYVAITVEQGDGQVVAAESGHFPDGEMGRPGESATSSGDQEARISPSPRLPVSPSHTQLVALPLVYQGEALGQLLLAPRAPGEPFTAADRRLLDDLARQAGVAAHAVRLTADLQRSRERLVAAREEERRRLRRDLHDGLGPQLASLTLKLDAARNLLARDASAVDGLLGELKGQTQAAIGDIRRLVYALRPPALDELGLVGALRQQAAQYQFGELSVLIDAPAEMPVLPAAVEVAAYRIAMEALTNVVKHAGARTCIISLGVGRGLSLDIRDDGRGLPEERSVGIGLHSMHERAAELGGRCEIGPAPGGGTSVVAWLPL
jgi:signal transduction histidine kinase